MKLILDASALLAWLQNEPGSEQVEFALAASAISSLNWSEVLQKSLARGADITELQTDLEALGLVILPFDVIDAKEAAELWLKEKSLSLADRACIVLGVRHNLPIWTTDRMWSLLSITANIHLIR